MEARRKQRLLGTHSGLERRCGRVMGLHSRLFTGAPRVRRVHLFSHRLSMRSIERSANVAVEWRRAHWTPWKSDNVHPWVATPRWPGRFDKKQMYIPCSTVSREPILKCIPGMLLDRCIVLSAGASVAICSFCRGTARVLPANFQLQR